MKINKILLYLLVFPIIFSSCASSTVIDSIPSKANLYINGKLVGQTPYKHRDTKIVGSSNTVMIEKKGYRTYQTSFAKNEKIAVGPLIGGMFLLFPYLWIMKYEDGRVYQMRPVAKE
jgi:hypothetical protein